MAQTSAADLQWAAAAAQREKAEAAIASSIERQKASVRQQKAAAKQTTTGNDKDEAVPLFFVANPLLTLPQTGADCDRLPPMQLEPLIARAAKANQVSADLVRAVMEQESSFRACVVSEKGAMGLMQLMPGTAADLGVVDAFDPEENAFAGAKLLHTLMVRYNGDLNRTLGAYNAGPSAVDAAGGPPKFPETEGYIEKITRALGLSATAP